MLSIRLGSFSASTSPSLQPSLDEHYKRSSGFLRCLSPCKKPQTSYKSSSGSWLLLCTTSTLSLPVNPDECSEFVWVLSLSQLGPSTSLSPQLSPDKHISRLSGFLRCLSHLKKPQTSSCSSSSSLHL